MKKNLIASIIVSLATTGLFGGVSFAADAKPAVTTEAKADAPAPKAKAKKEKTTKKKVAKKAEAKTEAATPEAGK